MRILLSGLHHETNTFSNVFTTSDSFRQLNWEKGEEIVHMHRSVRNYLGGMIDRAEELGIEIIPVFYANACPSGLITRDAYQELRINLIEAIKSFDNFDAVCLVLHGSASAEGIDDLEGDILRECRNMVGNKLPILATLDLHANVTKQMVEHADILLGVNYYPHVDCYERGMEVIDLACKIVNCEIHPVMHLTKLPLLFSGFATHLSPVREINEMCWQMEAQPSILDCTFFHGFPYANIPILGASILTITNNDTFLAKRTSDHIATEVWKVREQFLIQFPTPLDGVKKALSHEGGPIVINETSDNPGGGAPGDGIRLLEVLIRENATGTCFASIFDPATVELAFSSGAGENIRVSLGGKTDSLHGQSLLLDAYVKTLTDGKFRLTSPMGRGTVVNMGNSVRLQVGNVDIIVCSSKAQILDEQIFLLHGIDVHMYKIVALKSSNHFRAAFQSIGKDIISVDSPGLTTQNFAGAFHYTNINRPIYPLDIEMDWQPENQ